MSFRRHSCAEAGYGSIRGAIVSLCLLALAGCAESGVGPDVEVQDRLLFLSARDGATDNLGRPNKEIYRMNADGSGVERLTDRPAAYVHLSLSPDGREIAFAREGDIWVMSTDGGDPVRLTNRSGGGEDGGNARPRWSPDGSRIAFATNREMRRVGHTVGLADVYVMNADGSSPRNVSHSLGDGLGFNVHVLGWSPAGQVVFETDGPTGGGVDMRVYLVNADGTGLQPLFDRTGDYSPAWSPDGSKVAFISERDGRHGLYIMNADGSGVRALTSHPGRDRLPSGVGGFGDANFDYDPWSPDGSRIVFERYHDGDDWGTLYLIHPDGSGLRRLTDHSSNFNGWAPDGIRIAFTRHVPIASPDVYLINTDGSGLRNLTNGTSADTDAVWLRR